MSTSSLTRRARGLLVLVTLALLATVLGPAFPAEADANGAANARRVALPPPGDDDPPGDDGGDGLPPGAAEEIDAVIAEVAEPVAAQAESDAAGDFFAAVLLKVADLQARFGNVVGPGEVIPFTVLATIENEMRSFLEPYAHQICDNRLVLPGISEEVQRRLAFRWWYPFVPLYFFGWLFFRKSICANRFIDEAISQFLYPCTIARGHNDTRWTHEMSGDLFLSYSDAATDFLRLLIESGHPSPYEYFERHPPGSVLVCIHD
jgi:hypothetical protein